MHSLSGACNSFTAVFCRWMGCISTVWCPQRLNHAPAVGQCGEATSENREEWHPGAGHSLSVLVLNQGQTTHLHFLSGLLTMLGMRGHPFGMPWSGSGLVLGHLQATGPQCGTICPAGHVP